MRNTKLQVWCCPEAHFLRYIDRDTLLGTITVHAARFAKGRGRVKAGVKLLDNNISGNEILPSNLISGN